MRPEILAAFLARGNALPAAADGVIAPAIVSAEARPLRALAHTLLAELRVIADEIGQVAAAATLTERAELAAEADRLAAWRLALNDLLIAFAADLAASDRPGVPRAIWEGRDG